MGRPTVVKQVLPIDLLVQDIVICSDLPSFDLIQALNLSVPSFGVPALDKDDDKEEEDGVPPPPPGPPPPLEGAEEVPPPPLEEGL